MFYVCNKSGQPLKVLTLFVLDNEVFIVTKGRYDPTIRSINGVTATTEEHYNEYYRTN